MAQNNNNKNDTPTGRFWTVDHDKNACALCVVCARNCPTGALRRDQGKDDLSLYFNASLCDGCGGDVLCEKNCPEKAIVSVKLDAPADSKEFVLLNQSEMIQCEYCEEYFAPARRIDVVSGRAEKQQKAVERNYCPLCRRSNLVIEFIEQHRLPGAKAQYRQANDILRRAYRGKKKPGEE